MRKPEQASLFDSAATETRIANYDDASTWGTAGIPKITSKPLNGAYEFAGDEALSKDTLADAIKQVTCKNVRVNSMTGADCVAMLTQFGMPAQIAQILAGVDASIDQGGPETYVRQLSNLIGQPTTSLVR